MKKSIIVYVLIIITLILTGCNKYLGRTDSVDSDTEANDSTPVSLEDKGPSQGGILNLFMYKPDTLNPIYTKNKTVKHLSLFVFDPLICESKDEELKNCLVENHTASENGLTYDFELKDNIYFHDRQGLKAEDAVFTIEEIIKAGDKSPYSNNVSNIESVTAVDRLRFRIILKEPDQDFLRKLNFPVLPEHVFKDWPIEGHNDKLKLVGTGPFTYDSFNENEILLLRNDSYWNVNRPEGIQHPIWLDGIRFKIYLNESDMMIAFQKKEIDIAYFEVGNLSAYSQRSDIFYNEFESNVIEFLVLSPQGKNQGALNSPISREDFRKAIIEYLCWYSEESPLESERVSLNAIFSMDVGQKKTDRSGTIAALESAGFKYQKDKNVLAYTRNGIEHQVVLSLLHNGIDENRVLFSDWITRALMEIGIKAIPENASYEMLQQAAANGKFDMMLLGCRFPMSNARSELAELIKDSLNISGQNYVLLPLYRKNGVVLYNNNVRGPREPIWNNVYNGWQDWYLVQSQS